MTLLRNLIVSIFLIALAFPALAVPVPAAHAQTVSMTKDCHGMPVEHDGGAPTQEGMKQHGCIGCIAPYAPSINVPTVEQPAFAKTVTIIRELYGTIAPPSLPPPRA